VVLVNIKIKWGILSTAQIGVETVIPAIFRTSNSEVHAIASSSGKARDIAEKLNIPHHYESYDQLLEDPEIDAVYIPLPNNMHSEWTMKAAKQKKHVLCEKPAALNENEVEEMINVCRENQVLFMEAFMYRFHAQHKKVKELIQSGAIGDIKMLRSSFSFFMENREGNIRLNPDLGGGAIYDVGCYCVNVFRYILDSEPISLYALGHLTPDGVETSAAVTLKFPNDILATFDCSFDASLQQEYEIVGTKGSIRVPLAFRPDINGGNGIVNVYQQDKVTNYVVQADQYLLEIEHFSDCILHNKAPIYSEENTVANMKVIDAIYQSLRSSKSINLK
jgi:xylose dehydrogenase (NAD/NADP)